MHQLQKIDIFKKLLKVIFRVATLYACESLKAQSKFPDVYSWFEKRNNILEGEIRGFLREYATKTSVKIDKRFSGLFLNLDMTEDEVVFIFAQYYWDSYQFQVIDYNEALVKDLGLEKNKIIAFFQNFTKEMYIKFGSGFIDKTEFMQHYHFSAFVGKDRFIRVLFQYFKLLSLLEDKNLMYVKNDIFLEFFKLIREIPYHSIISRSSISEFKTYPTYMGKKYYTKLQLPLDVNNCALVDNIIHFIFQNITQSFYFELLKDEPCNFDILRFDKLINKDDLEEESELGFNEDDDFNIDFSTFGSEFYERLDGYISIIENLINSLPQTQRQIFNHKKEDPNDIAPLLLSVLFANFIRKYDLDLARIKEDGELREVYELPLECNAKKIKSFYKFLEKGFLDVNLHALFNHMNNADNCQLYLMNGNKEFINMCGKNIKDNFSNHKKFFNY